MRGKAFLRQCRNFRVGITPAYAGKSKPNAVQSRPDEDHPRVCGEKFPATFRPVSIHRITPAYAGKSFSGFRRLPEPRDHPRVCGEKLNITAQPSPRIGSPPRMRGKDLHAELDRQLGRITPAYAGKSHIMPRLYVKAKDHPRVCGEKFLLRLFCLLCLGSPPRMRGKEAQSRDSKPEIGITPAYAGKRLKRSRSTVPHAAIVPLFPSVCNKPAGSDGSPAGHDAPPFLPIENAAPASPAYNLRSL